MADNQTTPKTSPDTPAHNPQQASHPQPQSPPGVAIGQPQPIPPQILAAILAQQAQQRLAVPTQLMLPGIVQQAQHWQGPYPPPEAIERYEKVLPGSFNRLIAMAEQLQTAQIEQSNQALESTQADSRRGHWLGFLVSGFAIFGALFCIALGSSWVAVALVSVPVMAVARALVEATKAQSSTEIIRSATPSPSTPDAGPTPEAPNQNGDGSVPLPLAEADIKPPV